MQIGNAQKRKMHVQLERLHLQDILITQIICSMFHFLYGIWLQKKRANRIFMLQKEFGWRQENHFSQKCLQIKDFCWQVAVYDETNWNHHLQIAKTFIWMCNVSHTYCFNGLSALVPSAVVIRRMIVKMLFVFLLSETLIKLIVR